MIKFKIFIYIIFLSVLIYVILGFLSIKGHSFALFSKPVNTKMNISVGLTSAADKKDDLLLKKHKLKDFETYTTNYSEKEFIDKYTKNIGKTSVEKKVYKISRLDKQGLIDENNQKITQIAYDDFKTFNKQKGLYKSVVNNKVGLIDIKSGVIIPAKFQDIIPTKNEDVVFIKNYKYFGLFDTERHTFIAKPIYVNIISLNKNNWKLYSNQKVGLVYSENGNTVFIKPKYSEIEPYRNVFKSYIGEKTGLISYKNSEILSEPLYNSIEMLNDINNDVQVFRTNVDNRYGVIFYSKNGELTVISPIYQDVQYKGRVNVLSGGYWRILDNKGNVTTR